MVAGTMKTEKEYRAVVMDSSSSLKEFSLDRKKYYKKYILGEKLTEEEDTKASVIGRVVETLLFEKDEFDNRFSMSSLAKSPTGLMLEFVEALYRRSKEATDENGVLTKDFSELAELAYKDSGFKIKLEAVLGKFVGSDAEIYYKEIREIRSKGLTIVTTDDVTNAERIVEELKKNEFTSPIFSITNSERYDVRVQHQVEGYSIDGLELKSMMDIIIIDHKFKTIQVYDLKCVWSVEGFYTEYYLYRRAYIQAYLYKEACMHIKQQENLEYYTVLEPKFVVCDSINYYNPLIYSLDSADLMDAYKGFTYNGRAYPGVKEIIANLKWNKSMGIWNISKTNHENKGIVRLKG